MKREKSRRKTRRKRRRGRKEIERKMKKIETLKLRGDWGEVGMENTNNYLTRGRRGMLNQRMR